MRKSITRCMIGLYDDIARNPDTKITFNSGDSSSKYNESLIESSDKMPKWRGQKQIGFGW